VTVVPFGHRRGDGAPGAFRLGDRHVDAAAGTISDDGGAVRLEPKVMDVLVCLAQAAGRVVSKDEILATVWPDTVVEEAALSRCISELRRGLGDDAKRPRYIETIPKRGYRVIAQVAEIDGAGGGATLAPPASGSAPSSAAAETPAARTPGTNGRAGRWPLLLPWVLVAVLALVLIAGGLLRDPKLTMEPGAVRSLAILPVENLTGDPGLDFFAEGITDGLTTELGRTLAFDKVTSRSSAMRFNDGGATLVEIGRILGVEGLVEASVLSATDVVRLNVRLVHAASEGQVWSDSFEGEAHDIAALYAEVARSLVRSVRAQSVSDDRSAAPPPVDPAAYAAYLRGRHFWNQRSDEGFRRAEQYFKEAVTIDRRYAAAYAGLADNSLLSEMPSREVSIREARTYAARALALDDSLAEAHTTLAFILVFDWQWQAAEDGFRRAIELNPSYATAHHWYGLLLSWTGRHTEAEEQIRRARELDPLSPQLLSAHSVILRNAGQYEEALEIAREAVDLEPTSSNARFNLASSYMQLGRYDEGVEEIEGLAVADPVPRLQAWLMRAYAAAGRQSDVDRLMVALDALDASAWREHELAPYYAGAYVARGDHDRALEYLEQGYADGLPDMVIIAVDPWFGPLHGDERFVGLLRRMGLSR